MRVKTQIFVAMIVFLMLPLTIFAWPLPDDGRDDNGVINPLSYTKLDANGNDLPDDATEWVMVRDNVTGLIWEVKQNKDDKEDYANPHDADNTYTWYDGNPETNGGNAGTPGDGTDTEDFINALNAEKFGGFSDWRLPGREELRSIVDYGEFNPAILNGYFPNVVSSYYWSSTTYANSEDRAWIVYFASGSDYYGSKSDSRYVRAVRGGQARSFGHLVINGDGTVTDTEKGVMWQQATVNEMSWENALNHCESMTLGGYDAWRLPDMKELSSIVDMGESSPLIKMEYFPDTVSSHYWSSTTYAYDEDRAWLVGFNYGNGDYYDKSYSRYVRAVRGGQ